MGEKRSLVVIYWEAGGFIACIGAYLTILVRLSVILEGLSAILVLLSAIIGLLSAILVLLSAIIGLLSAIRETSTISDTLILLFRSSSFY
ncbi:hypothetical protein [Bacillus weihaiensis]|uniref:hypothetical protein n=1 Tax=Bacillus weihaiensis TaxID=1547283 RepID=UPI002354EE4A|nr:hypothetical protein [Bacillus weihaiensis]